MSGMCHRGQDRCSPPWRRRPTRAGLCRGAADIYGSADAVEALVVAVAGGVLSASAPRRSYASLSRPLCRIRRAMGRESNSSRAIAMPAAAKQAALSTFAQIIRERNPGVIVVPLGPTGDASAGRVMRPFAMGDADGGLTRRDDLADAR